MVITEKITEEIVTDAELSNFQKSLGLPIPIAYCQFLKLHNGGRPNPSSFEFKNADGKLERSRIHYFFGLHSGRVGNLRSQFETYHDRIPLGLLPVATDPFGNLILLKLIAKPDGPVFFWDHENEGEDEPTWENVFQINPSFEDFTKSLA